MSEVNEFTDLYNKDTSDSVVRFLFEQHAVRGEICYLNKSVNDLLSRHNYPRALRSLMLELSVSAVLISSTLKADAQIMVQLQGGKGEHAIRYALININEDLSFYGSALYDTEKKYGDELTFKDLAGEGASLIISVFPKDGNKWQGIVPLDGEGMADALQGYFNNSEQLPSTFFIYADPDSLKAGGLMLQIIPEAEGNTESLEHLTVLGSTLKLDELREISLYEALRRLYGHDGVKAVKEQQVRFKCVCSRERCETALTCLNRKELADIAEDKQGTEMTCQHCGQVYHFTQDEVKQLLLKVSQ